MLVVGCEITQVLAKPGPMTQLVGPAEPNFAQRAENARSGPPQGGYADAAGNTSTQVISTRGAADLGVRLLGGTSR